MKEKTKREKQSLIMPQPLILQSQSVRELQQLELTEKILAPLFTYGETACVGVEQQD